MLQWILMKTKTMYKVLFNLIKKFNSKITKLIYLNYWNYDSSLIYLNKYPDIRPFYMISYNLFEGNGTQNVKQINNSYIFDYPCGNDLTDCTYYVVTLRRGTYAFEAWGAQGGGGGGEPGKGGYSRGVISIPNRRTIYLFIGAQGDSKEDVVKTIPASWNGGGQGFVAGPDRVGSSGGGGTDIRYKGLTENHRILVAGGGGGSAQYFSAKKNGGSGGGLNGIQSSNPFSDSGKQNSPGKGKNDYGYGSTSGSCSGLFFYGGYCSLSSITLTYGGGGGGWFGGSSGDLNNDGNFGGGGGGSGYVLSLNSYTPERYSASSWGYFDWPTLIDGDSIMPKCEGSYNESISNWILGDSTETGHSGNGCIRITILHSSVRFLCTEVYKSINLRYILVCILLCY